MLANGRWMSSTHKPLLATVEVKEAALSVGQIAVVKSTHWSSTGWGPVPSTHMPQFQGHPASAI